MIHKLSSKPRSNTYVGTVNNDAEGWAEYEGVKKEAREFNAAERLRAKTEGTPPKYKKTDCFARLGENNPRASKYRKGGYGAYQRIDKKDGVTLDIYVSTYQKVSYTSSFTGRTQIGIRNIS
jgi:hypothetical protein